jgi:hypothetical protein
MSKIDDIGFCFLCYKGTAFQFLYCHGKVESLLLKMSSLGFWSWRFEFIGKIFIWR